MNENIPIATRLTGNWVTCKFSVNQELHRGAVYFVKSEEALGSPLAEAIFKLPDVTAVKIAGGTVSVTRQHPEDWPSLTRPVAALIREWAASGHPCVDPKIPSNIPSAEEIRRKVEELLDREINPAVAGHGGVIELIDVKDATVYLRMGGGCQGCASSTATLKQGVERTLRDAIPQLDEILDVTDHASGTNPYYAPAPTQHH